MPARDTEIQALLRGGAAEKSDPSEEFILSRGKVRRLERSKAYVITSAQNNTEVEGPFLEALLAYCEWHEAQLMVIPVRYQNPTTSVDPMESDGDRPDYWWPSHLHPYMVENRVKIHKSLEVVGDIKVQATAAHPLSGFEAVSGSRSAIYGHGQVQMMCVPTPQNSVPKIMHTTGSISKSNYSSTKAGAKAQFFHKNGACVVFKRGKNFHLRHIEWCKETETFYDLDEKWTPYGIEECEEIPGIVLGDEHAPFTDPKVVKATYGPGGIVERLQPREIVRHDLFDGASISNWERNDPIIGHIKRELTLKKELTETVKYINKTTPDGIRNVVVASNHNDRFVRWLKIHDPRSQYRDNEVYFHIMNEIYKRSSMGPNGPVHPDPFALWCETSGLLEADTLFLERGEGHMIEGIEVGFHGDKGSKGSRGSRKGFSKIGVKTIIGHSHSPGIEKECYQVGWMMRDNQNYMKGSPSDVMHTHCIIHPNGKRQLVNIINGKF